MVPVTVDALTGSESMIEVLKVNYNLLLLIFFLQGDYGGYHGHQQTFVTFQKAKLSCSDGKDYPVNFNEIRKW